MINLCLKHQQLNIFTYMQTLHSTRFALLLEFGLDIYSALLVTFLLKIKLPHDQYAPGWSVKSNPFQFTLMQNALVSANEAIRMLNKNYYQRYIILQIYCTLYGGKHCKH